MSRTSKIEKDITDWLGSHVDGRVMCISRRLFKSGVPDRVHYVSPDADHERVAGLCAEDLIIVVDHIKEVSEEILEVLAAYQFDRRTRYWIVYSCSDD